MGNPDRRRALPAALARSPGMETRLHRTLRNRMLRPQSDSPSHTPQGSVQFRAVKRMVW